MQIQYHECMLRIDPQHLDYHQKTNAVIGEERSGNEGNEADVPETSLRIGLDGKLHSRNQGLGLHEIHNDEVDSHNSR